MARTTLNTAASDSTTMMTSSRRHAVEQRLHVIAETTSEHHGRVRPHGDVRNQVGRPLSSGRRGYGATRSGVVASRPDPGDRFEREAYLSWSINWCGQ